MTAVMALRAQYKDSLLKKHGVKLGFMSAFAKAVSYGLQDQPSVNASALAAAGHEASCSVDAPSPRSH